MTVAPKLISGAPVILTSDEELYNNYCQKRIPKEAIEAEKKIISEK